MMDTKITPNILVYKTTVLVILLILSTITAKAQEEVRMFLDTVSLDKSIRHGRLANGFTYFIKSVDDPKSKVFMRLYTPVGSNYEGFDQFDVAHGIEHLAYKSTKNFPLGINNSEHIHELGMGMYDYITAFSGPQSTEYHFNAPNNNIQAFELGLLFFKDIIINLNLTDKDITQVKGELRQEFLSKVGDDINKITALTKMHAQIFPCTQDYSNFLKDSKNFTSESLRRFYKDWYHPEKFALSVVGNIEDSQKIEGKIRDTFSKLKSNKQPLKKNINCDSSYFTRPRQFVVVEQQKDSSKFIEDDNAKIHLIYRDLTRSNIHSIQSIEKTFEFQFLVDLVWTRLNEITQEYKSFDIQISDLSKHNGMPRALEIILKVKPGGEDKALKETIRVLNQLQKHGVSDKEWKKYKEKQLDYLNQITPVNSTYWIDEIAKYYIKGEVLPTGKLENIQNWLANYSLEEFNQFLSNFLNKQPEDIGLIGPTGNEVLIWSEIKVRKWIDEICREPAPFYLKPETPILLMSEKELAGLQEVEYKDSGIGETDAKEIILENGVKVVLKKIQSPTGINDHLVRIHGYSLKGAKSFSNADFYSAFFAPEIVRNSGVNGLNKFQLERFLSRTTLRAGSGFVYPYVYNEESGIQGEAAYEDLEILMQLIYLYFTKPNKNKAAFEDWKLIEYDRYINPSYSLITTDFDNKIADLTGDSLPTGPLTGTNRFKGIANTDYNKSFNLYNQLFGNASDFLFIITGNFDEDKLLSLVQKYLGNLPNLKHQSKLKDIPRLKDSLRKPTSYTFSSLGNYKANNINYGTRFIKKAIDKDNWQEQLKIEALGEILRHKLWALRFDKGYALYDVRAAASYNKMMDRYEVFTYLNCEPKEFYKIKNEIKQIFSELRTGKISNKEFEEGLKRMYSIYDIQHLNQAKIIHQNLYDYYRYNTPWLKPEVLKDFVKSITVADIVSVAQKYCSKENLEEFVMGDKFDI